MMETYVWCRPCANRFIELTDSEFGELTITTAEDNCFTCGVRCGTKYRGLTTPRVSGGTYNLSDEHAAYIRQVLEASYGV